MTSVVAFRSVSVRSLYREPDELSLADVGQGGELDQGVEGDLDVGEVLQGLVQEVGQDAAEDGLVTHQQHVPLSLQLHHHRLQPRHQVLRSRGECVNLKLRRLRYQQQDRVDNELCQLCNLFLA